MAKFLVTRKEVWNSFIQVEAESVEEAIQKVEGGEDENEIELSYSFTLDTDLWEAEKIDEVI